MIRVAQYCRPSPARDSSARTTWHPRAVISNARSAWPFPAKTGFDIERHARHRLELHDLAVGIEQHETALRVNLHVKITFSRGVVVDDAAEQLRIVPFQCDARNRTLHRADADQYIHNQESQSGA